jgi:hypothetical protein
MSKQQTAVEWLWGISQKREIDVFDFELAIEMEKNQIIDAFLNGDDFSHLSPKEQNKEAQQYYNETYNDKL